MRQEKRYTLTKTELILMNIVWGIQTFIARTIGEVIKKRKMSDLYHFGDIPPTREEAMNSTWGE